MQELLVQQYRDRWQAVARVEAAEGRAGDIEQRWRQTNALSCMAAGLGLDLTEHDDQEIVWFRWSKLKGGGV